MAKKHKHPEHENLERWLVSYADFITLLFAFFTVLYALSQSDKAKYQKAVDNIQRSFLSAGGIHPLKGTPFVPFDKPPGRGSEVPPGVNESGPFGKAGEAQAVERIMEQVRGLFARTMGLGFGAADVEVVAMEGGYKLRLAETLLYKPGSDKLKKEYAPFLFELGRRLMILGVYFQIEGHTDNAPGTTSKGNWDISIRRAMNLAQFFIEAINFPQDHMAIAGYGDTKPLAKNDTPEGRAKNRRVEIAIISPNAQVIDLEQ